jgi:arylsulfatase A-like enzyme
MRCIASCDRSVTNSGQAREGKARTRVASIAITAIAVLESLTGSLEAAPEKPRRPNIVFIVADDLRWNTLGCIGDPVVRTPNIDRLAHQGVTFDNCFVTTSICWVSRASMFTGQWYSRHRIESSSMRLDDRQWAASYPALLNQAGYRNGFIGKFGVGSTKDLKVLSETFDYWRGLPGQAGLFFDDDDPTHTHKTARFGNEAVEFIDSCSADQPFCLSLSFSAPHARDKQPREFWPDPRDEQLYQHEKMPVPPLATDAAWRRLSPFVQECEGRKRWEVRFKSPELTQSIIRDYYRLITGIDREVGRILDTLARKQFGDNTVIVFISDNGFALGDRGMADKWFMYEEDIRVPLIVYDLRMNGGPRRGRKVEAMVLNVDIAPTLLDLAGVAIPSTVQGRSLLPLLHHAKAPADWRTEFFYEHHYSGAASIPGSEGVRTETMKYIRWTDPTPVVEELYDLKADPLEEHNLVADPRHLSELKAMRERWAELKEQAK